MALPAAGEGTLRHRLGGVRLRAKTGTLDNVSALSGWVWNDATDGWIEFSIADERDGRVPREGSGGQDRAGLANGARPPG